MHFLKLREVEEKTREVLEKTARFEVFLDYVQKTIFLKKRSHIAPSSLNETAQPKSPVLTLFELHKSQYSIIKLHYGKSGSTT